MQTLPFSISLSPTEPFAPKDRRQRLLLQFLSEKTAPHFQTQAQYNRMGLFGFGAGTLQPYQYFTLFLKASSTLLNQFAVHKLQPTGPPSNSH